MIMLFVATSVISLSSSVTIRKTQIHPMCTTQDPVSRHRQRVSSIFYQRKMTFQKPLTHFHPSFCFLMQVIHGTWPS